MNNSNEELKKDFDKAMREIYHKAKKEADYTGRPFFKMIKKYTGFRTAQYLLLPGANMYGFNRLCKDKKRPDLTVEFLVLQPKWAILFTDKEINMAKDRLKGFLPNDSSNHT